MIEVFDDFLTQDEIMNLWNVLKGGTWTLEEGILYPKNEMEIAGGGCNHLVDFTNPKEKIYKVILDRLYELPILKGQYIIHYASRNAYKVGDMGGVHQDSADVTALIYGNPIWHINWGSETIFTDSYSKDSEIIASIIPKPGRLVVFDSKIPHTGRAPNPAYVNHRFSVAYNFNKIQPHDKIN